MKNYILKEDLIFNDDETLKEYLTPIDIEPLIEVIEKEKEPREEPNTFIKSIITLYHFENYSVKIFINNQGCIECSNCIIQKTEVIYYIGDKFDESTQEYSVWQGDNRICWLIGLDEYKWYKENEEKDYEIKGSKGEFGNSIRIDFVKKDKR